LTWRRQKTCDTRDQDSALRCRRCSDGDGQAGGRNDAMVGPKHCGSQPSNAVDEAVFRVHVKPAHGFLLITPSRPVTDTGVLEFIR
jgi:hypothetical protein